ncbi:MAG: haloacid dehalogenase [Actinobacteria bacterium 13_2_20CM_2_71_6]|nr:MAG: haloacid dehalogenase [Actinobacteria bacterium 13_2_20CM_2_71_6]
MTAYRAVLFDFFGTLTTAVSRGPAHRNIARWLGCDPRAFAAALNDTFLERARGGYGPPARALRRVTDAVGGRPSRAQLAMAQPLRMAAVQADTSLREDAVPVLRAVKARGLRTGLISDCGPELPRYLPTLPIAPLLDTCVYSIEVRACKPDPAMYLTACRRLLVEPRECLYIGDGGSQELSGARAVGMTAIRLAAPDLAGHLRFNGEQGWTGPAARSLTEALSYLDA